MSLKVEPLRGGDHLTWKDNSSDEDMFMIERMDLPGGTYKTIMQVPFNTTAYHDATPTAGKMYMYRVMATNNAGGSAYSNEATLTVP